MAVDLDRQAAERLLEERMDSLSRYQNDCAKATPSAKPYKQGPVVRLDNDVRRVQEWAGIKDPKGASMTRDTCTAMRDKIEEYQRQNGIQAKTPGELNKDTLDRMRADPSLPKGLVDSLQKVKPYYKLENLERNNICVRPGQAAPAAAQNEVPMNSTSRRAVPESTIGGSTAPARPAAGVQASLRNIDSQMAARDEAPKMGGGSGFRTLASTTADPAPVTLKGPARLSDAAPTYMHIANSSAGTGLSFNGSTQQAFAQAKNNPGPLPIEKSALERVGPPAMETAAPVVAVQQERVAQYKAPAV